MSSMRVTSGAGTIKTTVFGADALEAPRFSAQPQRLLYQDAEQTWDSVATR